VADRGERLSSASLYLVCDAQPDEFLHAALRGGVDIVQLRAKHALEAELLHTARRYREITAAHDALLIVNDHPELALAADADGVHVGQDDMPVAQARQIVGHDRLVGLSTHTPAQIDAALGVDYIGVGPVHSTPTKPGRPAVGLDLVRYAASHAHVPFFAIGGIDPGNVDAVRSAGANRIAVVRALTLADDPEAAARALQGVSVGAA
jgi:thiamine-phosphate pyrophosphorylase